MAITFRNDGLIDLRAVTTFGVSAKDTPNPIGFFGTGLKYAIACVLRNGGRITIFRGLERYDFYTEREIIRDQEFALVYVKGPGGEARPLGFTTHLGARWEPWMVFRELMCNTVDEGGVAFSGRAAPTEGVTTITVDGWAAFEDAYAERSAILLETAPLHRSNTVEAHRSTGADYVYYRGVRAGQLGAPSRWAYNLVGAVELTEDRTIKYQFRIHDAIRDAVLRSESEEWLEEWLTQPKGTFEHGLPLDNGTEPSEAFFNTVRRLRTALNPHLNPSAADLYAKVRGAAEGYRVLELTPAQREALAEARRLAELAAGQSLQAYPTEVVESLGAGVYGMALLREQRILIARRTLDMGSRFLASTLLEETLHLSHGFEDCSRDFQNYLLDRLLALVEGMEVTPCP